MFLFLFPLSLFVIVIALFFLFFLQTNGLNTHTHTSANRFRSSTVNKVNGYLTKHHCSNQFIFCILSAGVAFSRLQFITSDCKCACVHKCAMNVYKMLRKSFDFFRFAFFSLNDDVAQTSPHFRLISMNFMDKRWIRCALINPLAVVVSLFYCFFLLLSVLVN